MLMHSFDMTNSCSGHRVHPRYFCHKKTLGMSLHGALPNKRVISLSRHHSKPKNI
jgi:hypothetical protein